MCTGKGTESAHARDSALRVAGHSALGADDGRGGRLCGGRRAGAGPPATMLYRLFPVPKSKSVARLIYDMSSLTPFLPHRPCVLPTIERALEAAADGFNFALKIYLRDVFFSSHSAGCEHAREFRGVL